MMVILHVPHVRIVRHTDVVVWTEDEARPFAIEEAPHRLNLLRRGLLTGDVVVQPEDEQRVYVAQHAIIERKLEAGLVYPLEHWNRCTGDLADELLERRKGPEE
jgi:hypothetical protein